MNQIQILFILFLLITFFAGAFAILSGGLVANPVNTINTRKSIETMEDKMNAMQSAKNGDSCPNMLVQKGNVLMLYDTTKPVVDGSNPIPFFSLDDYIKYLEIQQKNGVNCPVLYLQQENDAQGNDVYRMRPSPFDLQGGLPAMNNVQPSNGQVVKIVDASRSNPPYNAGNYAGFDPQGQYVGVYTEIDKIHDSTEMNKISDNPMDSNWAGVQYTQKMVDSGKYAENAVTRPVLTTPKNTTFYPTIPSNTTPPRDIL